MEKFIGAIRKLYQEHLALLSVLIVIVASIIGCLALTMAYCCPVEAIRENIAESSDIYEYEGPYPQLIKGYKSTQLDNFTDTLLLATAMNPRNGTALYDSLMAGRSYCKDESLNDVTRVTAYASNETDYEVVEKEYPRYWHGYLLFLKPLLVFFNVADIRMINLIVQMSFICYIIYLLMKKNKEELFLPFVATIVLINPLVTAVSFQNSSIFYTLLLSIIYILKCDLLSANGLYSSKCSLMFLLIGIWIAYFDLLTYPLLAFSLPMAYLLLYARVDSIKQGLVALIQKGLYFSGGYVGMWGLKWVYAGLLTDYPIVKNVVDEFLIIMGSEEEVEITFGSALMKNFMCYFQAPYIIIGFLLLIVLIIRNWKLFSIVTMKETLAKSITLLLLICVPFVHMLGIVHSWYHNMFTHREFAVVPIVIICLIECTRIEYKGR